MDRRLVAVLAGVAALVSSAAFAMTKEEEDAAWKKEPAYGQEIRAGYNGALCLGAIGIAQKKGFYAEEGLNVKVARMAAGNAIDAVGTGKCDLASGHIAKFIIPTVNGVRMKFTTGVHTGCKSLYVLKDSPVKSTKDLIGKTIVVPSGIGIPTRTSPCAFSAATASTPCARSSGR